MLYITSLETFWLPLLPCSSSSPLPQPHSSFPYAPTLLFSLLLPFPGLHFFHLFPLSSSLSSLVFIFSPYLRSLVLSTSFFLFFISSHPLLSCLHPISYFDHSCNFLPYCKLACMEGVAENIPTHTQKTKITACFLIPFYFPRFGSLGSCRLFELVISEARFSSIYDGTQGFSEAGLCGSVLVPFFRPFCP